MRSLGFFSFLSALTLLACGSLARADHAPVYAIPQRPDVPLVIDGFDASYTFVEGDWGLARPGHMAPIIAGPLWPPVYRRHGGYYPTTGRRPAYGRREVIPSAHRVLPPPAESYHRYWSSSSDPVVASPDYPPPPVIVAPVIERDRRHLRRRD